MSVGDLERKRVEDDAKAIADKYGECSEYYAENRSEAAKIAGEEEDARHWDEVAETLSDEGRE